MWRVYNTNNWHHPEALLDTFDVRTVSMLIGRYDVGTLTLFHIQGHPPLMIDSYLNNRYIYYPMNIYSLTVLTKNSYVVTGTTMECDLLIFDGVQDGADE